MRTSAALLAWLSGAGAALAQGAPLSAIDWLSDSVAAPVIAPRVAEPPVTSSALPETILVTPLDRVAPDTVGLVAPSDVGLDAALWSASSSATLARQLAEMRPPRSATMQRLLHDLLRVRADAPRDSANGAAFFLARVDALLAAGRFDLARDLMARAGSEEPQIFRRWFDLTLLMGGETQACARMRALPEITPTYPARIFCLARSGDWPAAVLTLESARVLGVVTPSETERLMRFLDDGMEGATPAPPPARPTPLDFLLYEAMGAPMRTARLPLPFAHADLRPNTGWKARIEAGERLARAGAIDAARLWAIYNERMPAASGQLWDRVEVVQRLDRALRTGDPGAVSGALPRAWDAMAQADLLPMLANRTATKLARLPLSGAAASRAAQAAALAGEATDGLDGPLATLAAGGVPDPDGAGPMMTALIAGLTGDAPAAAAALIEDGRIGEALFHAIRLVEDGRAGNLDALSDGLAILRAAGVQERARQAATEVLVTGWRG